MSQPFELLEDRLLKAGIAPRHVRRYIRELDDHFADLIAMQNERGYEEPDATLRARALLGDDDELFHAMARCREFRSLPAKAPWLVFGILPPVAIVAVLLAMGIGMAHAVAPLHGPGRPLPAWVPPLAQAVCNALNYGAGPLTVLVVLVTAWRQRLSLIWPLLGLAVAVVFGSITTLSATMPIGPQKGEVSLGIWATLPELLQSARFLVTAGMAVVSVLVWKKLRSPV